MAEQYRDPQGTEYEETVAPENPPSSVANPQVRRGAWWLYFFPLVVIAIVFAVFFWYWTARDSDDEAIGTTGTQFERPSSEMTQPTPGGGDPGGDFDSTQEELERRGGTSGN